MERIFDWIGTYGPGALFLALVLGIVGLPVPDETLLVFSGYLISKGKLHLPATVIAAVAGSWCGISVSYGLGRTLGLGVVRRFGKYLHVDDTRLEHVHAWFNRRGHWALFIGYYIAGVRHITAVIAGASGVEFRNVILYGWSGGLIWAGLFLGLGYFVGEQWRQAFDLVGRYMHLASYLLIAAAVGYGVWRWKSGRFSKEHRQGAQKAEESK